MDINIIHKNSVSEFSFGKVFLKEVLWVNITLIPILSLVFSFDLTNIIILTFVLFLTSTILLYILGYNRKRRIEKINSLIQAIRTGNHSTVEEIKLDSNLEIIESNLKKLYEKNQKDIVNVKRLAQSRTDFLGNVSHELRTPIFSIQGFLETLLNGAIDDKKVNKRFLEKAMQHTENLNALLNDLIDISMIESGQMRMRPKYFKISELIKIIVEELEILASQKSISLETEFYDAEAEVFGDIDKIKQVLVNLVTNSIKYSENGIVKICTKENENRVAISIKDSGFGISESDLPRVFERFYRVDKARSKDIEGTGLGLAIVKHITEAHGSKIEVKSKLGKGSTFKFYLRRK